VSHDLIADSRAGTGCPGVHQDGSDNLKNRASSTLAILARVVYPARAPDVELHDHTDWLPLVARWADRTGNQYVAAISSKCLGMGVGRCISHLDRRGRIHGGDWIS
jgi:hypothetical protein